MPKNFNIEKVLVAPLDWGLGHATRCIPIIRGLLSNGFQVVLAAEGVQASLLHTEFPDLLILPLVGYRVRYSNKKWMLPFTILRQLPGLFTIIKKEHSWLQKAIKEHKIDLVISDNRYGLSTRVIPCIFITHQLTIKAPFRWLENLLRKINYHYINQFTACWVPDVAEDKNAAGLLSHPTLLPHTKVHYLGLLSRFQLTPISKKYEYCILLSGPEPQRTLLEKKLLLGLDQIKGPILFVRGKPGSHEYVAVPENVIIKNHLPGNELQLAILQSEYIISRSGYTTIMELLSLQKKAILIPTPGQTEQEWLADWLQKQNLCITVAQANFDLVGSIKKAESFSFETLSLPLFKGSQINELLDTL